MREVDFLGGRNDQGWDACNGHFDDGTPMHYQTAHYTWLRSYKVLEGYTIQTATQCNDDFQYAKIETKATNTASDGCVNANYDFNYLTFRDSMLVIENKCFVKKYLNLKLLCSDQ